MWFKHLHDTTECGLVPPRTCPLILYNPKIPLPGGFCKRLDCLFSAARVMGGGPTRERGRPARMHSRCVPLGLPAMGQPATVPAGRPWAWPKQSSEAVAGRAGSRSWARPCQRCAGGTPALPGGRQGAGRFNLARRRTESGEAERHRSSPAEAGIVATVPAPATALLKAAFFRAGTGRTTGG